MFFVDWHGHSRLDPLSWNVKSFSSCVDGLHVASKSCTDEKSKRNFTICASMTCKCTNELHSSSVAEFYIKKILILLILQKWKLKVNFFWSDDRNFFVAVEKFKTWEMCENKIQVQWQGESHAKCNVFCRKCENIQNIILIIKCLGLVFGASLDCFVFI